MNLDIPDGKAREQIEALISKYQDIFHLENEPLPCNNFYTQHICLQDKTPVFIKNYRLPHSQAEKIQKQVQKLLDDDIIENSKSPYNAPLLLVPKKGSEDKKK